MWVASWSTVLESAIYLALAVYPLLRGGKPERLASLVFLAGFAVWPFTEDRVNIHGPQWGYTITDGLMFLALTVLAYRHDRIWLLFCSAFQLLSLMTHAVKILYPQTDTWSSMTAGIIWGYGTVLSPAVGTFLQQRSLAAQRRAQGVAT
jgi:hypothetical protein